MWLTTLDIDFGADGAAGDDAGPLAINDVLVELTSVGTADPDTGAVTLTSGGAAVLTSWDAASNTLTGYLTGGSPTNAADQVFTLSIDLDNDQYTYTQIRPFDHPSTDADGVNDGPEVGYEDNIILTFTTTATDGDGDQAQASFTVDVDDDIPQAGSTTAATLDDEGLSGIAGNGESSGDAAGELTTTSGTLNHDFGADGAGSIHFASLDGTTDTLGTETVTYTWDDASNTLTAASARGVVLTVVVTDPATGAYSVTLNQPVLHAAETAPGTENDATLALTYTVVDADGDAAAGTLNINIDDDTPAIDFSNLVGTVTTTTQSGFWAGSAGADQPGTLTVAVEDTDLQADGIQFDMVTAGGTPSTGTVSSFSFDSETGIGTGTLTADFDNNAQNGDESVNFTLTVNEDGSYEFTLDRVIQPVVTLSTDEGQLAAGGPDSVQTLTFGQGEATTSIVFFAADADTAVSGGIGPAILLGEDDLTEAQLEARAAAPIGDGTFPFIREEIEMNVSGTGIGVNNNVLQGEDLPGDAPGTINSFDSGAFDESFVVNPEALSSSVTVYISKTAGGFLPPNEDGTLQGTAAKTDYLYINIYDEEGNSIGPILITSDMVFDEADVAAGGTGENLWSFTIDIDDLPLDGDYIDAIQFTMGFGDIKIPKIEVVARGNEPANDISLDFSATLTDADGDSTTTDFAIDLDGNDVITETQFFDYTLVDAGDTNSNAFNVDLSSDLTEFLVTGFDNTTDDDKLLLLGDAGGTVSIDNSGDDSIVTVEESGGQITRITVDGVDLVQDDVVLVGDGEEDLLLLQDLESTNDPKATNSYETDQVFSVSLTSSDSESSDSSAKNQNLITEDYITSEDTLF
jgi:T1SS-143 domain-containing protein